jgi:hypothetical protein
VTGKLFVKNHFEPLAEMEFEPAPQAILGSPGVVFTDNPNSFQRN